MSTSPDAFPSSCEATTYHGCASSHNINTLCWCAENPDASEVVTEPTLLDVGSAVADGDQSACTG